MAFIIYDAKTNQVLKKRARVSALKNVLSANLLNVSSAIKVVQERNDRRREGVITCISWGWYHAQTKLSMQKDGREYKRQAETYGNLEEVSRFVATKLTYKEKRQRKGRYRSDRRKSVCKPKRF